MRVLGADNLLPLGYQRAPIRFARRPKIAPAELATGYARDGAAKLPSYGTLVTVIRISFALLQRVRFEAASLVAVPGSRIDASSPRKGEFF